jgi:NitT/TauT family transport system substrate-binding protein
VPEAEARTPMLPITRRRAFALTSGGALSLISPMTGPGLAAGKQVRFAVEFSWEGNHGLWTLAKDRGYFSQESIDIAIDRGYGAANNITKLVSKTLDIAVVDPNLLPKFNREHPESELVTFFIIYDAAPSAIIFLKSSGIKKPTDLEGRKLALTEGTTPAVLFPVFAKANAIDASKVELIAVNGQLRDTMIIQKSVDAAIGFITTSIPNFAANGIAAEDVGYFQYNKFGLELYSLGLVCLKSYAKENPDVLRGFVKAAIKGARAIIATPDEAIASVKAQDGLLNDKVELMRTKLMNETALLTPNVAKNGISSVDRARFEKSIGEVGAAMGMNGPFKMEDYYTDAYLPPAAERKIN